MLDQSQHIIGSKFSQGVVEQISLMKFDHKQKLLEHKEKKEEQIQQKKRLEFHQRQSTSKIL